MKKVLYFILGLIDSLCFFSRIQAKRFIQNQKIRCIHYGSGDILLKNWLNVDLLPWLHLRLHNFLRRKRQTEQYLQVNILKTHPFKNNYFDYAYCQDLIEHFTQGELVFFLLECFRTLRSGGVLRLSFPQYENVLKRIKYLTKQNWTSKEIENDSYTKFGHRTYFSPVDIKILAANIGYSSVQVCRYRSSGHKLLRNLDFRYGNNAYIELTK